MKKAYCIVDKETNEILDTRYLGRLGRIYYEARPDTRKGFKIQYVGLLCMDIALALFMAGCFLRILIGYALFFAVLFIVLGVVGWIAIKSSEKAIGKTNPSKVKVGYWSDPYGLARNYVDDGNDARKAYYIIDSETNAIVDIIRLGKWGQKWLHYRAERQTNKTTE